MSGLKRVFSTIRSENFTNTILVILLILALIVSYLTFRQNIDLKNQLFIAQNEIDIGYKLLPLEVYNASYDNLELIKPDSLRSILYFFSMKCKVCLENQKYWDYIVKKFSKKYRIYTISLDSKTELKSYLEKKPKEITIYYLNDKITTDRKILRTPMVLIINQSFVERKWLGLPNIEKIESL